jgi:hypothetical protein
MIIECLVRREGPTTIELEKTKYLFMPIPGVAKKGISTTSICQITAEEHIQYLLKRPSFREYDAAQSAKEQKEYEKNLGIYSGFSVQKYQDKGYIVVDLRDKKKPRYGDNHGRWVEEIGGLSPFSTEFQAYEFLKEEIAMAEVETEEKKTSQKRSVSSPAEG